MLSTHFKKLQDFYKTLDIDEAIENGELAESLNTIKALTIEQFLTGLVLTSYRDMMFPN